MEQCKRLLSAKEAAVYLGVSHRTLWHWARTRWISSVRLGRRVLFDREYLDKVIEQLTEHEE
jgi:excisionase family DNA binding protein